MNKVVFLIFLLVFVVAQAETKKKTKRKPSEQESPYQVTPLDSTSDSVLKNSDLAPHVKEEGHDENAFRNKVKLIEQKLAQVLPKGIDRTYFIYDCMFLLEEGFQLKYPNLTKQQIGSICRTVRNEFSK